MYVSNSSFKYLTLNYKQLREFSKKIKMTPASQIIPGEDDLLKNWSDETEVKNLMAMSLYISFSLFPYECDIIQWTSSGSFRQTLLNTYECDIIIWTSSGSFRRTLLSGARSAE